MPVAVNVAAPHVSHTHSARGTVKCKKSGFYERRHMSAATSFSFPKTSRLTRPSEFDRVRSAGISRRGQLLVLNVLSVEDSGSMRAGLVTSRRVGGAVVRNRVRRRLREIVRHYQHQVREGIWIVLIARPDAASASYRALEDEWLRLAKRASILI